MYEPARVWRYHWTPYGMLAHGSSHFDRGQTEFVTSADYDEISRRLKQAEQWLEFLSDNMGQITRCNGRWFAVLGPSTIGEFETLQDAILTTRPAE